MSVYRHQKSRFFHYDLTIEGNRFRGSTGQETKRNAEAYERKIRTDFAAGRLGESSQFTLDQAAGKWWTEVGRRRRDADDVERRVGVMLQLVGRHLRIVDVSTAVLSEAIEKRRGQTYAKSPAKDAKRYLPSNTTVNRDIIDTLRPILERARKNWSATGLPAIDWKALRLEEPREVVRYYSDAERASWAGKCGPEARLALDLMLTYGLRYGELFFPLDAFEPEGPRLNMQKGRKLDIPHSLPLRQEHAREIAARAGRAWEAGLEHIWFKEVRAKGGKLKLVEITYSGLESRISRAADNAGIKGARRIHGARHHAGTDILRKSKNLKMAQRLLGHSDIKSTMRYVHTLDEDLREALGAGIPRNTHEPEDAEVEKVSEDNRKTEAG